MSLNFFLGLVATCVFCCSAKAAELLDTDWPQWRGPHRDGQAANVKWPAKLQGNLKQAWRVELGPSYSGPIIGGKLVFTTETRERKFEVVRALDRDSGKEIWKTEWEGALSVPFFAKANGDWIRATPAFDGERLYVAGMRDLLVCISAADGKVLWQLDFCNELKTSLPSFGFVSSPLVDSDWVYCQAGASIAKVNKLTGKICWRALEDGGGMWGSAFSSPIITTLAGERQLVVLTREKLAGLRLDDGKVLWEQKVEAFRGMNILTPVAVGDAIFTAAYGGKAQLFGIEKSNDIFKVSERWNYKAQGNMSTPVVVNNCAWLLQRSQRLVCIDLNNGKERWLNPDSFGQYWSLVSANDKILALDARGILFLLNANTEKFEQLDSLKISEESTWAHIAVSGQQIFIRDLKGLSAWQWE